MCKVVLLNDDPLNDRLFENEINIYQGLKDVNCPHLVKIRNFSYLTHSGQKWFVHTRKNKTNLIFTEYLSCGNLSQWMKQYQRFNLESVKNIITQILKGLKAIHDKGLIHQGINPDNIYLRIKDNAQIQNSYDFTAPNTEYVLGGYSYCQSQEGTLEIRNTQLSPYNISLFQQDQSIDIWSIGVLAFELFFGVNPIGIDFNDSNSDQVRASFEQKMNEQTKIPLNEIQNASLEFLDFIDECLTFKKQQVHKPTEHQQHPQIQGMYSQNQNEVKKGDAMIRPDCQQLLNHPFITNYNQSTISEILTKDSNPIIDENSTFSIIYEKKQYLISQDQNQTKGDSIQDLVAKHKAKAQEKKKQKDNKIIDNNQEDEKVQYQGPQEEFQANIMSNTTFEELGICSEICEAIRGMGYKNPTKIQAESLPYTLKGRDMIGLAETGSGKTAAFAIPVIQKLLENPQPFFACIMSPTRELCVQIAEQFEALGSTIGLRTAVLVGGLDMVSQAIALSKNPHVVVGTPGRMADHLANTKGFHLKKLKFLIFDEADRLLSMDFEKQINLILTQIPKQRNTFLFSATMTSKVQKLERASLNNPVKIEVSSKFKTVDTLVQNYIFIPAKHKETYLIYLLTQYSGQKVIIFTTTCNQSLKLALILRNLNYKAVNINGQLSQQQRLNALNKFKSNERQILIATDVASRGLDIPEVDLVINFDIPQHSKDYIHRVGRTARAGNTGRAITIVTQYDVEIFQKIETLIGTKLEELPGLDSKAALILSDSVVEAQRLANMELKNKEGNSKQAGAEEGGDDDDEQNTDMKLFNKNKNSHKHGGKKANFAHQKGFGKQSFARKRKRE